MEWVREVVERACKKILQRDKGKCVEVWVHYIRWHSMFYFFIKYIVCLCGICVFLVRNGGLVAGVRTHMVRLINIFVCHTCIGFFCCCLSFRRQFNCEHFHEFFINLSIILESKQRYGIRV